MLPTNPCRSIREKFYRKSPEERQHLRMGGPKPFFVPKHAIHNRGVFRLLLRQVVEDSSEKEYGSRGIPFPRKLHQKLSNQISQNDRTIICRGANVIDGMDFFCERTPA